MYLAPLNYDRFFKKVFSDLSIAQAFLEDFLEVTITSIELLENTKRFTDKAAIVEFDFRVKIDDQYVIIDMQQWYKPDVAQRFFLYHALNSGLQLETLPQKKLIMEDGSGKVKEIKDYRRLEPITTLVWMVDDCLGFDLNYAAYRLMPHTVLDFLNEDKLWQNPQMKTLLENRLKVMQDLENNHKGMSFLAQNSLTFMFQKNIIKSPKIERYKDWFIFAQKTKNRENTKEDFEAYATHAVFGKIISRLNQTTLTPNDFQYIEDEDELTQAIQSWERSVSEESWRDGIETGRREGKALGRKEGKLQGREEGREEGRQEGALMTAREAIIDVLEVKYGPISTATRDELHRETDLKRLKALHKTAIQTPTLEDFLNLIKS